jgi:tRNA dimethylallyltransferase
LTKTLLVVGGPTASGKTELAINLALYYNTEIVSADARQFYRELTIGTAKPSVAELLKVTHHFINSHSVTQHVNAADYGILARVKLEELFRKHDVVVMAGGSGLFIDAVAGKIDELPAASPEIKNYLQELSDQEGLIALQELLKEKDPLTHSRIDLMNPRRIIRALEVTLSSGKPFSTLIGNQISDTPWKVIRTGILHSRETLYERINTRTGKMITEGLKEEALSVYDYKSLPSLQTVGYREMFEHIEGKFPIEVAQGLIAQHTRNYAKRQMTWFRRYQDMLWIKPGDQTKIHELIS